jgi:hypothetical protein
MHAKQRVFRFLARMAVATVVDAENRPYTESVTVSTFSILADYPKHNVPPKHF